MNFKDAVKSGFTKFAEFKGRASRSEYWWFILFTIIIRVFLMFLINNPMLDLGVGLVFLLPTLSAAVRRMHDVGKSGWYVLIPIYNLILACTEGDNGSNEYGNDPEGVFLEDEINAIGTNQ